MRRTKSSKGEVDCSISCSDSKEQYHLPVSLIALVARVISISFDFVVYFTSQRLSFTPSSPPLLLPPQPSSLQLPSPFQATWLRAAASQKRIEISLGLPECESGRRSELTLRMLIFARSIPSFSARWYATRASSSSPVASSTAARLKQTCRRLVSQSSFATLSPSSTQHSSNAPLHPQD